VSEPKERTCAYPGCEVVIGPPPELGGPAPGYCDDPEHNAHSTYHALKCGEGHAAPDTAARLGLAEPRQGSRND
jgi:hypothetical protein